MSAQLAASAVRFGWFYGLNRLLDREARRLATSTGYRPKRPMPSQQELLAELASLFLADAAAVRDGLYPAMDAEAGDLAGHVRRVRAMFEDLPRREARRSSADAGSVRAEPGADEVPDYYAQDFHFQTGGYLSQDSAALYDVQVETLFYGAANAMRRTALAAVARRVAGRDQRRLACLDVACGTGRFLRQMRLAWPAIGLTGLDLSPAYLREAERHMGELRPALLVACNAEDIPLPDASQDIVTCIYLFHELPPEVRRRVAFQMARVLRPGGHLILLDSLQMGDKPGWDGLLEAFPVRFHEPYYRHYVVDDLDGMLTDAGLVAEESSLAFLSKLMVRRKA